LEETEVATPGVPVLPARYAELRAQLVFAVRRLCPAWMADDAEDFVQESLVRLIQRTERLDGTLVVSPAYLKKVAYCAIVDEMRRRQRSLGHPSSGSGQESDDVADESQDLPNLQDAAFIGSAITQCLAHQIADRRRAVTLHLLGHTVPEAARILGCKAKRVENLVYRGLAQLRECLARRGLKP
jgi:RNA polymerase sigma-70 factor (ECF subfamily)